MLAIQSELKQRANNQVRWISGLGPPTSGVTGTGVNDCGPGSFYTDITNALLYINTGTALSPLWTEAPVGAGGAIATGQITSANLTGAAAGQFGNANGVILVPAPGAGKALVLESAVVSYVFATAAYTAGAGNTTVNWGAGGAAITGAVTGANFAAAASSKPVLLPVLSTAGIALVANASLNLVTTVAFTQPGTAAGVINWAVSYYTVTL
jgi:hypothetical protein